MELYANNCNALSRGSITCIRNASLAVFHFGRKRPRSAHVPRRRRAHPAIYEQVVEIEIRSLRPGRAMQDAMRDADDAAVVLGHKPEHRFTCIRETLECGFPRVQDRPFKIPDSQAPVATMLTCRPRPADGWFQKTIRPPLSSNSRPPEPNVSPGPVLFGSDKGALHGVYTGLITPFLFAEVSRLGSPPSNIYVKRPWRSSSSHPPCRGNLRWSAISGRDR